jgi:HK97 family phage portal protein
MTVLLSGGLPKAVSAIPATYERWGSGMWTPGGAVNRHYNSLAYEEMYRSQPAVFSVVNRILYGICRLPIEAFMNGSTEGSFGDFGTKVEGHPLAVLLNEPWEGHSQWELKERLGWDLLVHGKCLALKFRPSPGRPPKELWPVPWRRVIPIADVRGIIAFQLQLDGYIITVSPRDVLYLELAGAGSFGGGGGSLGGLSPLEPLRRVIGIEEDAIDWQSQALRNGFSPRAVFTAPKLNMTNDLAVKAARAQLDKLYAGPDGEQYAILGDDADVKVLSGLSAVDLDLIKQRQSSREDVCACYDVQASVLGFASAGQPASYASAKEWRQSFYIDGIGPKVTLFDTGLNTQLVRSEPTWSDMFVRFDMRAMLAPDPEGAARRDLMDMQSGTNTTNERRSNRGLKPIGDPADVENPANMPWIAANGYPLGFIPEHVKANIVSPATIEEGTEPQPATPADLGTALTVEAARGGNS